MQLDDVSHIIELITSHHTVISVTGQLHHIVDCLRDAQILDLLQQNPCKIGELFASGKRDITADVIIALFEAVLSPCGHNDREEEEAIVVYWMEFIQKVEGTYSFDRICLYLRVNVLSSIQILMEVLRANLVRVRPRV